MWVETTFAEYVYCWFSLIVLVRTWKKVAILQKIGLSYVMEILRLQTSSQGCVDGTSRRQLWLLQPIAFIYICTLMAVAITEGSFWNTKVFSNALKKAPLLTIDLIHNYYQFDNSRQMRQIPAKQEIYTMPILIQKHVQNYFIRCWEQCTLWAMHDFYSD